MEMSEITIAGKKFPVRRPYAEGSILTAGEANGLNQTRNENVRNNLTKLVKSWDGTAEGLAEAVDKYDAEYAFGIRAAGEPRVTSDPVTTEAKAIAREAIKQKLEAAGQKADAKQINAAVEKLLANETQGPKFRAVAEQRIAERKRLASQAMEEIDISGINTPEGSTTDYSQGEASSEQPA